MTITSRMALSPLLLYAALPANAAGALLTLPAGTPGAALRMTGGG